MFQRKKFGDGSGNVVSCAPEAALMKVSSGCVREKFFTAMPSSPESGERRICTLSCSMSFFTARTAESGVASVEAITNSSFFPPAVGPYFFTAALKPPMPSTPRIVYVPSSVAVTPTLMVSSARATPQSMRQASAVAPIPTFTMCRPPVAPCASMPARSPTRVPEPSRGTTSSGRAQLSPQSLFRCCDAAGEAGPARELSRSPALRTGRRSRPW